MIIGIIWYRGNQSGPKSRRGKFRLWFRRRQGNNKAVEEEAAVDDNPPEENAAVQESVPEIENESTVISEPKVTDSEKPVEPADVRFSTSSMV